jgi:hypothetical protein
MRTPRPASKLRVALGAVGVSLVLAACGGGGGGGGGGGAGLFLPTIPATGNTPPDGNLPANDPPDNASPPPVVPVLPVVSCADLAGKSLPASAIGLPTQGATVTSATPVAAGDVPATRWATTAACAAPSQPVDAQASQRINFAVNLPAAVEPARPFTSAAAASTAVLIDGTEVDPLRPGRQARAAGAGLRHLRRRLAATSRGSITDGAVRRQRRGNWPTTAASRSRKRATWRRQLVFSALLRSSAGARLLPGHLDRRARRAWATSSAGRWTTTA